MYNEYRDGRIEVICGCMFAGKSEELRRRMHVQASAHKHIQAFCFEKSDDQDFKPVKSARHLLAEVAGDTETVLIDDIQFFDEDIVDVCVYLADAGKRVIVAGLDQDFRGDSFGVVPELLTQAEEVTKLTAICARCGAPATCTQLLINGEPAPYSAAGDQGTYEPRCRHCHEVPGRPLKKITRETGKK